MLFTALLPSPDLHACRNAAVAVSPADSRVLVFDSVSEAKALWVKGKDFTIAKLLGPG
jgi:phosphatidylserine decarboxylase